MGPPLNFPMKKFAVLLACGAALTGCVNKKEEKMKFDQSVVQNRLQRYSALVLAMDSAGLARMYMPDGELVNPRRPAVKGREAIQKFLEDYSDYKVLSNEDVATSTMIDGDTAEQVGTYHQKVRAPNGKVFETSGRLEIEWQHTGPGEWLIVQLETFPAN
jgi:ketosteroid isomerase-like protein